MVDEYCFVVRIYNYEKQLIMKQVLIKDSIFVFLKFDFTFFKFDFALFKFNFVVFE
jgi:hypothetical protein